MSRRMNWSARAIYMMVAISIAAIMMMTVVTPALAQQGPQIQLTDFGDDYSDCPDVAIDSNNNVHIAFEADDQTIWYTMLDNNGNTLIGDTVIYDVGDEVKPAIGVDSQDHVHIVWQSDSGDDIAYIKLDPYLDDMSGDAANLAAIQLVARTVLYSDDYQQDPRIAIDSNDDVHVVWENYDDYEIAYMQLNSGGGVVVPYTVVADTYSGWQRRPFVAVDSNDNPHIVWNDDMGTVYEEIFYAMLDGSDGSISINATLITDEGDDDSKRSDIVVDDQDMVHIFWSDERDTGSHPEIYYTKLDPSQDDQDGTPADESAITVIDDTPLTTDDDNSSCAPQAAFQCGYIHVTWKDARWDGDPPEDVFYMVLNTYGNIIVSETALTTGSTLGYTHSYADNVIPVAVDANGKAHAAWCDGRDGYYEIWYTTYQGPPCGAPPVPVGGEAYPTNKVSLLAPWLGLALLAVAGGILVVRRRTAN